MILRHTHTCGRVAQQEPNLLSFCVIRWLFVASYVLGLILKLKSLIFLGIRNVDLGVFGCIGFV
jgi:hypothetical protein